MYFDERSFWYLQHLKQILCHLYPPANFSSAAYTDLSQVGHFGTSAGLKGILILFWIIEITKSFNEERSCVSKTVFCFELKVIIFLAKKKWSCAKVRPDSFRLIFTFDGIFSLKVQKTCSLRSFFSPSFSNMKKIVKIWKEKSLIFGIFVWLIRFLSYRPGLQEYVARDFMMRNVLLYRKRKLSRQEFPSYQIICVHMCNCCKS